MMMEIHLLNYVFLSSYLINKCLLSLWQFLVMSFQAIHTAHTQCMLEVPQVVEGVPLSDVGPRARLF